MAARDKLFHGIHHQRLEKLDMISKRDFDDSAIIKTMLTEHLDSICFDRDLPLIGLSSYGPTHMPKISLPTYGVVRKFLDDINKWVHEDDKVLIIAYACHEAKTIAELFKSGSMFYHRSSMLAFSENIGLNYEQVDSYNQKLLDLIGDIPVRVRINDTTVSYYFIEEDGTLTLLNTHHHYLSHFTEDDEVNTVLVHYLAEYGAQYVQSKLGIKVC